MKCHRTNAEGSSQISNLWEDTISEELFAFWGLCIGSGILGTRNEPIANLQTTNALCARPIFHTTVTRAQYFQILSVIRFNDKTTRNKQ
jgi:hypothetical protein